MAVNRIPAHPRGESDSRAWLLWFQKQVQRVLNAKADLQPKAAGKMAEVDTDGNLADSGKVKPQGDIVGTTDEQTLSLKTLDEPDIADYTLANHTHTAIGDGGQLTEDSLALEDITTNDTTKDMHGFCPKLPDDAAKFLDGKGNWTSPGAISAQTDVTASRAFGTVYQNTGTSVMWVSVIDSAVGSTGGIQAFTGDSNPPTNAVGCQFIASGMEGTLFFPVLPSWYYKVESLGGAVDHLAKWTEWS